ncbi:MAG: LCP family protein [Alicyclobacillaceae bacterium]|nr:LCP family protein [Alicyclobacillaceae bacterium]
MRKRLQQRKSSTKRVLQWVVGATLTVVATSAGAYAGLRSFPMHTVHAAHETHETSQSALQHPTRDPIQLLLIGTDARPKDDRGNTDVLMVARLDPIRHRISILSIPRDTQVAYPDGKYHKINQSLQLGNPELTKQIVQRLLGIPIDGYVLADFRGIIQIVNLIGGLSINVPERMHYDTGDKEHHRIWLEPGFQTLDGEQALGFVRFRHDALGDVGRTERQQEFMRAFYNKLIQPSTFTKLPSILHAAWSALDTDIPLMDVLSLSSHAEQYRSYRFLHETLPGSFHNPDPRDPSDLSYWVVNPAEAQFVARQFFLDGKEVSNPIQDPHQTQTWHLPNLSR